VLSSLLEIDWLGARLGLCRSCADVDQGQAAHPPDATDRASYTRFRDPADIVLIARSQTVHGKQLTAALNSERRRRRGFDLPADFSVPIPPCGPMDTALPPAAVPAWQHAISPQP
jgi:hypothetical protein